MYKQVNKFIQIPGLILLIVAGAYAPAVIAAGLPDWAPNQPYYARILNPVAAQVMAWIKVQQVENASSITLESADLSKIDTAHYSFKLRSRHHSVQGQELKETHFQFITHDHSTPSLSETKTRVIEQTDRAMDSPNTGSPEVLRYRTRELAYWWLAHLDGVENARQQDPLVKWLDSATFQSARHQDSTQINRAIRPGVPMSGGHLLRTVKIVPLEIEPGEEALRYELRLFIDWRGTLENGKPGIASLEQIMYARLLGDGTFTVDRIVEKTRLPSLEPWTKILC